MTLTLIVNWIIFAALTIVRGVRIGADSYHERTLGLIILTGLTWAGGITFVSTAFHYTLAAYASSGQQIQIPTAIALGAFWLGEESFKQRLAAAFIMMIGVLIISLGAS